MRHTITSSRSLPLLNRATCVDHGFLHFDAYLNLNPGPGPHQLYKSAQYLVIQTPCPGQPNPSQLAIPSGALIWLAHSLRQPFKPAEGKHAHFEGCTLSLHRSSSSDVQNPSHEQNHTTAHNGFLIKNTTPNPGQPIQHAFIGDYYLQHCLLPFIDSLNKAY
ncbi:MAG: hypothetical protein RL497_1468 [Pseudomonadota bacterium]|jgi:hypothetical protein